MELKRRRDISEAAYVPIIKDGAIATGEIGEGRIIPVLILDCSEKIELQDIIYAHQETGMGDVTSTWAIDKKDKGSVTLLLDFTKPAKLEVAIRFDIEDRGSLVDMILHSNAVYLQPVKSGLSVLDGIENGQIIIEIPDTNFFPVWERVYSEKLMKIFRKSGLSKSEAKVATMQHKVNNRKMWERRM